MASAFAAFLPLLPAQQPRAGGAADAKPTKSAAVPKREPPTHAPLPVLRPLDAWLHIRAANAACLSAREAGLPAPAPERPGGAGRYVCAVFICADADLDIPAVLGLQRRDVLLISTPGPFVSPESIGLLERLVREERLSLVLILTHTSCRTLTAPPRADTRPGVEPRQDALAQRLESMRAEAKRNEISLGSFSLGRALVLSQREHLLASSDELRARVTADQLRIVPGEVDTNTGAFVWHHHRADELPLLPVK
jgi:carbonic anhydrase